MWGVYSLLPDTVDRQIDIDIFNFLIINRYLYFLYYAL